MQIRHTTRKNINNKLTLERSIRGRGENVQESMRTLVRITIRVATIVQTINGGNLAIHYFLVTE